MMTTEKVCAADANDAELVAESLAGGREAFRQIVERHQTLVCSLAYCATGNLTQSEDLAQETFLAAWSHLAELREPSKLRPWLCGIARFVIGKELRRQGREPVHAAATLESAEELPASEPLPSERVISREEQAILWRCVARIPEIYREPLVLFYREHQSIERVALALELSEDAVKQRLARGRKLLQEQALAYVEGALQHTNPGPTFTSGVLAALPLSAVSAKTLTVGAAVKGSSTAKTVASFGIVSAILLYWSVLGFLAFIGGYAGYWMSWSCARSSKQGDNVIRFWRTLAWGSAASFILRLISCPLYMRPHPLINYWQMWFLYREDLFCVVIMGALAFWIWRWWRDLSDEERAPEEPIRPLKGHPAFWLSLIIVVPVFVLLPVAGAIFGPAHQQHLSAVQAQKIITEHQDDRSYFNVVQDVDGTKTLHLSLRENQPGDEAWVMTHLPSWWNQWNRGCKAAWWNLWMGGNGSNLKWLTYLAYSVGYQPVDYLASADPPTLKVLDEAGIHYGIGHTYLAARDPWPFGSLLAFFLAPMGGVLILHQIGMRRGQANAGGISNTSKPQGKRGRMLLGLRADPGTGKAFAITFIAAFLLVFTTNAVFATRAFTVMGFYPVIFLGAVKSTFFGLLAAVGLMFWRSRRISTK
jgi:RNA polymerase sigma factor (sigma-70 family)